MKNGSNALDRSSKIECELTTGFQCDLHMSGFGGDSGNSLIWNGFNGDRKGGTGEK